MYKKMIKLLAVIAILTGMAGLSAVQAEAARRYYVPVKVAYKNGKKDSYSTEKIKYDKNANLKDVGVVRCYYKKNRLFKSKWASAYYVYTYDKKGRIYRRYHSDEDKFDSGKYYNNIYEQYSYNAKGKVSKRTSYSGSKKDLVKYFSYGKNGKLRKITIKDGKGKTTTEVGINSKGYVTYLRDHTGKPDIGAPGCLGWGVKKITFKYSYGKNNAIKTMKVFYDGKLSNTWKFTYKWMTVPRKQAVLPYEINPVNGYEWLCELMLN